MRHSNTPAVQVLLLVVLTAGGAAASPTSDTGDETVALTLQQATSKALANNPGIEAARLNADIERARSDALALGTPYKLEGEIENVAGSGELSGFDASETTLRLSKMLETGDKRTHRTRLGDMRSQLATLEITVRESNLAAEVARRYTELLRQQEAIDLLTESVAIAERTLEIVRRRVAVGRASEAEETSAIVALERADLAGQRLGFEIVATRVSLASLWGTTQPAFTRAAGDIYSVPAAPAYSSLQERLADNPLIARISTEALIRTAEQRVALSRQSANVEVSAGIRHLAESDDVALVAGFSVPFGAKTRAEPLVRESNSDIARTSLVRDGQVLQLEAALQSLYQQLLASRNELVTLRERVIPEAQRAVGFYERGFELGSFSLLELTAAQERLLAVRRDALDAATACHLTLIDIEGLLGSTNPGGALL
jgi:cobalt-zinc-cadmium efflux system outer membrane protein